MAIQLMLRSAPAHRGYMNSNARGAACARAPSNPRATNTIQTHRTIRRGGLDNTASHSPHGRDADSKPGCFAAKIPRVGGLISVSPSRMRNPACGMSFTPIRARVMTAAYGSTPLLSLQPRASTPESCHCARLTLRSHPDCDAKPSSTSAFHSTAATTGRVRTRCIAPHSCGGSLRPSGSPPRNPRSRRSCCLCSGRAN